MNDSNASFVALQGKRKVNNEKGIEFKGIELSKKYAKMLQEMREVFNTCRTKDLSWRRRQLEGIILGIQENHEAIAHAVYADFGGTSFRPLLDMAGIISDAEFALSNLKAWTSRQKVRNDHLLLEFQKTCFVQPEPKGVTLNISDWSFPILLSFQPLVPALAAGNCMVINPSEMAPNCAKVIQSIAEGYLDQECVKVIQGPVAGTTALLAQQWDHIFYTGNACVGRIVRRRQLSTLHHSPWSLVASRLCWWTDLLI